MKPESILTVHSLRTKLSEYPGLTQVKVLGRFDSEYFGVKDLSLIEDGKMYRLGLHLTTEEGDTCQSLLSALQNPANYDQNVWDGLPIVIITHEQMLLEVLEMKEDTESGILILVPDWEELRQDIYAPLSFLLLGDAKAKRIDMPEGTGVSSMSIPLDASHILTFSKRHTPTVTLYSIHALADTRGVKYSIQSLTERSNLTPLVEVKLWEETEDSATGGFLTFYLDPQEAKMVSLRTGVPIN